MDAPPTADITQRVDCVKLVVVEGNEISFTPSHELHPISVRIHVMKTLGR
jgi:hypothetical protein